MSVAGTFSFFRFPRRLVLKQFDVSISARSLNSLRTQMHPVAVTITRSRNTHAPTRSHFSTISFYCYIPIVICCYVVIYWVLITRRFIYRKMIIHSLMSDLSFNFRRWIKRDENRAK